MAANKVLLVDDDQGIIEVLKLYFEKEGYQAARTRPLFHGARKDIRGEGGRTAPAADHPEWRSHHHDASRE